MTNGESVTRIVEQNEDFCILTDDVAGTVTIDVSLDWWNQPKTDVLDKIRADIEKVVWEDVIISLDGTDETRIPRLDPDDVLEIIDKYKAESEGENGD